MLCAEQNVEVGRGGQYEADSAGSDPQRQPVVSEWAEEGRASGFRSEQNRRPAKPGRAAD